MKVIIPLLIQLYALHYKFYVNYFGFILTSMFGFILFVVLLLQLFFGFILLFYYFCYLFITFDVVNCICIEVYWGFLICIFHNIFASLFMSFIFMHFFKGVYLSLNVINLFYFIWMLGIFLLVLSLIVSVLGYILQFGNLGYWAFCVMKNLIILFIIIILFFLIIYFLSWFFIYDSSLLILHFSLAFILVSFVFVHIFYLHAALSINNLMFIAYYLNGFSLTLLKDLLFINCIFIIFYLFIFFNPILLGNYSNIIYVNFLFSPLHIKPEWYFCSIYAILRLFFLKLVSILMVLLYFMILLF